jgi:hypothetical protein
MPLAATADLVLADIKDVQQPLLHLSPGLQLPPCHITVLNKLTKVLTSNTITKDNVHVLPQPHESVQVETSKPTAFASLKADHPSLRVIPPSTLLLASSNSKTHEVQFALTPLTKMMSTYYNSAGIQGAQCCYQHSNRPSQTPLCSLHSSPRQGYYMCTCPSVHTTI